MKRTLLVTLVLLVPFLVCAQTKDSSKYNLGAELKFKGVVEEVKTVPKACTGETATHLMVRTDKALLEVQVAPEAFLKDLEITFAKGDKVEVTAAKTAKADGSGDLYLAREIDRNGNSLVVRDDKGGPVWTWKKAS